MIVRTRRQYRVLTEMQRTLLRSDPRLVARFTLFTRLTQDEDIPPFERVRGWAGRRAVMIIRRSPGRGARGHPVRLSALLLVPVLAAAMAGLLYVTGGGHAPRACTPARLAANSARHQMPRGGVPMPGCTFRPLSAPVGGR